MIAPIPADWWLPAEKEGRPVSPGVRQLLYDLSLIGRSPEAHGLALEIDTLEQLLRLLASPEGGTEESFWAVREWINRSGEMGESSDHAPDGLIDLYEEMGVLDASELSREGGMTPGQLLARLHRVREEEADQWGC
jgi:hypothetical protein